MSRIDTKNLMIEERRGIFPFFKGSLQAWACQENRGLQEQRIARELLEKGKTEVKGTYESQTRTIILTADNRKE